MTTIHEGERAMNTTNLDAALTEKLHEATELDRGRSDRELLRHAEALVDVLRKEVSGERDGDGHWCGSDPVEHLIGAMERALQRYRRRIELFRELTPRPGNGHGGLPF